MRYQLRHAPEGYEVVRPATGLSQCEGLVLRVVGLLPRLAGNVVGGLGPQVTLGLLVLHPLEGHEAGRGGGDHEEALHLSINS